MRRPPVLILLCVVGLIVGCAGSDEQFFRGYGVMFKSQASESFAEVQAKLGDYRAAAGVMPPGKTAILADFSRSFPADAIVYWKKEADDTHWRAKVSRLAWERIPVSARKGGRLRFTFRTSDLVVAFVTPDKREYPLGEATFESVPANEAPPYWL